MFVASGPQDMYSLGALLFEVVVGCCIPIKMSMVCFECVGCVGGCSCVCCCGRDWFVLVVVLVFVAVVVVACGCGCARCVPKWGCGRSVEDQWKVWKAGGRPVEGLGEHWYLCEIRQMLTETK